jgi:hypothetical protein
MFRNHIIYFCDKNKIINEKMIRYLSECVDKEDIEVEIHSIPYSNKRKMECEFVDKLYMVGGICDIICFGAETSAIIMLDILNNNDVDYKSILSVNPNNFFTRFLGRSIRVRSGISHTTVNIFQKVKKPYGVFVEGATNVKINADTITDMDVVIKSYIKDSLAGGVR